VDEYVRLDLSEVPAERAFTDPRENAADVVAIRIMAARLAALVRDPPAAGATRPQLLVVETREPDGRPHRAVLCDKARLRAARDLAFVGFFAWKRPGLDPSPLTRVDDELIGEFPRHPGILSYSSLELHDGNWANLILLDPPEAKDRWRESPRHAHAATELAPRHYTAVRLHNGVFPGGLLSGADPVLVRTRYHDFRGPVPWRAERLDLPRTPGRA
jgi:hypothetical protein